VMRRKKWEGGQQFHNGGHNYSTVFKKYGITWKNCKKKRVALPRL